MPTPTQVLLGYHLFLHSYSLAHRFIKFFHHGQITSWKHFLQCWLLVRGISIAKNRECWALIYSLLLAWTSNWPNSRIVSWDVMIPTWRHIYGGYILPVVSMSRGSPTRPFAAGLGSSDLGTSVSSGHPASPGEGHMEARAPSQYPISNFKAIRQFKVPISWLRDFTRSYEKTSFRILRWKPCYNCVNIMMPPWHGDAFRMADSL